MRAAVNAGNSVPVGPALSMFDPIYVGRDEYGQPSYLRLIYKNLLSGGEPGSGKSTMINAVCCHAALCTDARLVLFDGKWVELGQYEDVADKFVGPDLADAIITLKRLQRMLDNRYAWLRSRGRRKIDRTDQLAAYVVVVDELAYYSATVGSKTDQEEFSSLLRDLVARGRACGVIVVAATQRPSGVDIIPASLRDIFGYRHACRCTTADSSDLILGRGWASQGFDAATISPDTAGVGYLLAEGGVPRLMKTPWMTDEQIAAVVDYAAWTRRTHTIPDPAHVAEVVPITPAA
ncbi:FtsK/SpoIIIE domain-containing protein [Actinocatenispora sera]|uniref:FtsK/SpoIIIE domain-containing protein n=1 Tax=Actinocatenispora sera TaxID=390989 RepID=UPI0033D837D5